MSVEIKSTIAYQHSTVFSLKEDGTIEVRSVTKVNGEVVSDVKITETVTV